MTAFDTVTATISPALSTYIRCKGKAWKNAFIASLQRIAGVEYSVYKKKGSWQIRGDWDNIKQAHKILMKVTTTEDWLSYSVAVPSNVSDNKAHPIQSGEARNENEFPGNFSENSILQRNSMGLRGKSDVPVYNEAMLAMTEDEACDEVLTGVHDSENQTKIRDTNQQSVNLSRQGINNIKEEPGQLQDLNGESDPMDHKVKDENDPVSLAEREPKLFSKSKERSANRRKRGRPRKVQTTVSYSELSDLEGNEKSNKKDEDNSQSDEDCESEMKDLMKSLDDSDDDNAGNDSDASEGGDLIIDKMIKEGKDKIKSMKKMYHCDGCDFKCKSKSSLDEHKQRLHGNHTYKCPICDKVYGVKRDLKKHIRRHTSQFKCEHCGKTYKEQRNYRQHMKTHEVDYIPTFFQCKQCDKSFTTKYVLLTHVDQIHNGNRPEWLCNVCGKKFRQKHSLQEHHLIHTGERPFTCKICNKSFRHKGSLVNHELLHTDVRLYTCEVCGKDFKHRNSLRIHAVVHSKFRNFECPVCSKRFTQKQALNRHSRIHSGEKPFMCELCGDRFNDNSILRRHMMGIHKTELKSGKQHFVLPAEHYTKKPDGEGGDDVGGGPGVGVGQGVGVPPSILDTGGGAPKGEDCMGPPQAGPGLTTPVSLPDYRPGNETPPSLRVFPSHPPPHIYPGYQLDPSATPTTSTLPQHPPAGPPVGTVGQYSLGTAAMAAALSVTSSLTGMGGQFPDHHDSNSDHPIPLTTSTNQYTDLHTSDQNKPPVLPSMQFHRLY